MRLHLNDAIITLGLLALVMLSNRVQARPFWQAIPGAGMLLDFTSSALDTMNSILDNSLASAKSSVSELCTGCNEDPDTKRNVVEVIESRGFKAEQYDVTTRDGYILTIQRIVNPLVSQDYRAKMKPVIMQHGLMSSSIDWVINSVNVRPSAYPKATTTTTRETGHTAGDSSSPVGDSQDHPNSLGFYMANEGYDVFLANSRGNIYGQRHQKINSWEPKFWNFSFDEQIKYDLPDTIEFVQRLTNHSKLGYVGHSQGTVMMFGLLADRPEYADIVEPFIALAPVSFCSNSLSPVKYFAVYTPIFSHLNMWFATNNVAVKYLGPIVCGPKVVRREICANLLFLSVGFDEQELDDSRISAYLSHMPSGTSVKNIAHYGQEVLSGRFAHFDHGILGNQIHYGQTKAPDYKLENIRSESIVLFTAENDWLASPKDVARLKAGLKVKPFEVVNVTEFNPKWNHIDFVYAKSAGELVNTRILKVFEHFRGNETSSMELTTSLQRK